MRSNYVNLDNTDSVIKYFKEIKKVDLLTIDEEVELGNRIQSGDEKAVNELVEANLKFVISVAKEYQNSGVLFSDLINEGNYGLIKAAYRFDPTRGFRFISYAVYWIKQSIMQYLNEHGRTIRLPVNVISKINLTKKHMASFEFENGRLPTDNEEIDFNGENLIFEEINVSSCSSLNDYINEDGDELSDLISDDINIEDLIINKTDSDKLRNALIETLKVLNVREREIISFYFGLDYEYEPMTLEDIGDKFNLTKERIRQIKEKAIRKLRHNTINLQKILDK